MCGHAAKNERCQEGERHDEGVEEAVVSFPYTVPHPGAVMVESLWKRNTPKQNSQWTSSETWLLLLN